MKMLRYFGFAVVGLVAFCVISLTAVAVIVDGAFVKPLLERYLKEEKQRTLSIEGSPGLRIFPVIGLTLGKTVLSERSSDKVFVSLDSLEIGVRVMPLLAGEVAVDVLALSGLRANIVKFKDGRFNFQDLAAAQEQASPKAAPNGNVDKSKPPKLRVAEFRIQDAQVNYRDESSGQEVKVAGFNLRTGRLEEDAPSPISLSVAVTGTKPEVGLKLDLSGSARINLAHSSFALTGLDARVTGNAANLSGLNLRASGDVAVDGGRNLVDVRGLQVRADGMLDRDVLAVMLDVPRIEITPAKASGSVVAASAKLTGPQRTASALLRLEALSGSASALSISRAVLDIDASTGGDTLKAQIATPVLANLAARSWDMPAIAANVTLSGPMIPQKTVTLSIQAAFKADLDKQTMASEVAAKFDETSIHAKLAAAKLEPLNANFDISIDKLNLDRYMRSGGATSSEGDPPVDLSPLQRRTVTGKIQIGTLQAQRLKLADIKAEMRLENGKLNVAPHSASLYEGTLNGSFSADANANQIAIKEDVRAVAINPLLRDLADKDIAEGRGDVSLDVTLSGATVGAMKRAMDGSAKFQLKDGAYKGINLAETFRKASTFGSKSGSQGADWAQKTDFSEMSASFAIKKGVAHNDDLSLKSPLLRVGGSGDVDIGNSRVDYTAKASLVATITGQQGRDDAAGITIPVKIYGKLDAVQYDIQYGALFSGISKGVGGLFGGGTTQGAAAPGKGGAQPAPAAADAVKNRLKGLFGR